MTTTINGRTPEEIKKGLECCRDFSDDCLNCPYDLQRDYACSDEVKSDALAYIQQLERERDAAVEDLQTGVCCETCSHYNTDAKEPPCATCRDAYAHGNWEWRGVQEVE